MRFPVTVYPSNAAYNIYLQSYKEWLAEQSVSENTQRAYYSRIKHFLLFREYANLSENPLNDLSATNEAMAQYLNFLKHSKGQARSINANVNALNNFCQFLGLKAARLKRERCYYRALKVLSAKEQSDFMLSVRRQELARDRALALVLFYTGLRIGDCTRLNVADIAIVDHSTSDGNNTSEENSIAYLCLDDRMPGFVTKIPLHSQATIALKQWLKEREKFIAKTTEKALWLTKDGERLSISGITFILKRIGWQAHIDVSAEVLRRTWLSNANNTGGRGELATKFGEYLSAATVKRYGIMLPV